MTENIVRKRNIKKRFFCILLLQRTSGRNEFKRKQILDVLCAAKQKSFEVQIVHICREKLWFQIVVKGIEEFLSYMLTYKANKTKEQNQLTS